QNHALLLDLYGRHSRELNFVGVVANVANQLPSERERATIMAGNLVRFTLRADGAVFTKSGGGAPNVDMALVADRCEQLGVKTSLLMWETTASGDAEDSALFNSPALDAITSIGSNGFSFQLGPVERVIGPRSESARRAQESLAVGALRTVGAIDHLGSGRLAAARY
ncbi:MAG: hypothetical protein KGJ86_10695, partial [Chloroflexota bacterium]|nr:hypothetical protein [Chloroflexota bacterium]